MSRAPVSMVLILVLASATLASGQISADPSYTVSAVAGTLSNAGKDMAVDAIGNTYIMGEPNGTSNGVITLIDRFGVVTPNFHQLSTLNLPSQLCTNPRDGQVYFAWRTTVPSGPTGTTIWRIDPNLGPLLHIMTNVNTTGLAIDDQGNFYLGGFESQNGLGVYRVSHALFPGNYQQAVYLGPGVGMNDQLLAAVDGSLLIRDGLSIHRMADPAANNPTLFYTHNAPTGAMATIHSMARSSLNLHGKGVLIGVNEVMGFVGTGMVHFRGLDGSGSATPVLTETFILNGIIATWGTRKIASRVSEEILWYTHNASMAGSPHSLLRITQTPQLTSDGSLMASATSSLLTATITGPTPGQPLHLGVALGYTYHPKAYLPHAILELDPMDPHVIPLADGTGVFGPPDGSTIGTNFSFTHLEPIPPEVPSGYPITLQAFILDSAAPNALFYETNTAFVLVP